MELALGSEIRPSRPLGVGSRPVTLSIAPATAPVPAPPGTGRLGRPGTAGVGGVVVLAPSPAAGGASVPATRTGSAFSEPSSGRTSPPLAGVAGGVWYGKAWLLTVVGASGSS